MAGSRFDDWGSASPAMRRIHAAVRRMRDSESSVLITGESGTGKEVLARAIHRESPRSEATFLPVNCAAIPEGLIESELFGHTRGAFSGAHVDHPGLFQAADGGTLFLDEIGELPVQLQPTLLRALQEGEVRPVGATRSVPVDVRIIAATHQDLERARAEGRFREDLYFRLCVMSFHLPPLRDRPGDVLDLARIFVARHAAGRPIALETSALEWLQRQRWPGNARELENAVQRALTFAEGESLRASHFESDGSSGDDLVDGALDRLARCDLPLDELIRRYTRAVLDHCEGNKTTAASRLGISRTRLYRQLKG